MARVKVAADKALAALMEAVADPGTDNNRRAAEALVNLRKQFKHEGATDWAGRSPGYRDLVERLYRQAGVPSDSENGMQANLRYHLGNVLRQVAPPEELAALGLATAGPAGRVQASRQANPRKPKVRAASMIQMRGDPESLADLAFSCVRAIRGMEASDGTQAALRRVLDEVVDILADR